MHKALWTVSGTGKHACTTGDVTGVVVITNVVTATAQPQGQVLEDHTESMGAFHMTLEEAACLLECIFSGINSSTDHVAV